VTARLDVLLGAPDWARSDAVWRSLRATKPGFLAWYSRDGWDTSSPGMFDGVGDLLGPLLRADPRRVAAARAGETESPLLIEARGVAHVAAQGVIRARLKTQIHEQMRQTVDADRDLPERPALLARWARITAPPSDFVHTVEVDEEGCLLVIEQARLPEAMLASLANVLRELHRAEADEESGAWLAAQVRYAGGRVEFSRAFDGLPAWYLGRGPTLRALTWEMQQRTPRWRPAWATLLPV
jgi:hypothetical protein